MSGKTLTGENLISLIDHDSDSLSFDTTGQFPYLYYSRFNSLSPRDYDLIRVPLRFDLQAAP